jgi:hypothetical protein
VIPVIIQVTGTIIESLRNYLENIKWQPRYQGTTENSHVEQWAHISESSNNVKYKDFSLGIIL